MLTEYQIEEVLEYIVNASAKGKRTICTISSTAHDENRSYVTPVRTYEDFVCCGFVVTSVLDVSAICSKLDGKVDYILADLEKKLKIKVHVSDDVTIIDTGNIHKACLLECKKTTVISFKANDLTVDAFHLEVLNHFKELSGLKASVIGVGNIGTKIALRLLECGCDVHLFSRNFSKTYAIQQAIESIKSVGVISGIKVFKDIGAAVLGCEIVVLCASESSVLDLNAVGIISKNSFVCDIGKGNISADALVSLQQSGVNPKRLDYSSTLIGYIKMIIDFDAETRKKYGTRTVGKYTLVSGGFLGKKNNIIVDDYNNPSIVIGVCDGKGMIEQISGEIKKNILNKLKNEN